MSDVFAAADQKRVTLLGLLDLSTAFDCVDYDILRPIYSDTTQLNSTSS